MTGQPLAFEEFRAYLTGGLQPPPEQALGHDESLQLDRLQLLELDILLHDLGVTVNPELIRGRPSLRDLHIEYSALIVQVDQPGGTLAGEGQGENSASGRQQGRGALRGRRVCLRPLEPSDYQLAFLLEARGGPAFGQPSRGHDVSFDTYVNQLWHDVYAQFVAETIDSRQVVGLVGAKDVSLRDRTGTLRCRLRADLADDGWPLEALTLFVEHAFTGLNLRKLILEVPTFQFEQIASGDGRYFSVEANLREHLFCDGQWSDVKLLAFEALTWREMTPRRRIPRG